MYSPFRNSKGFMQRDNIFMKEISVPLNKGT